MDRDGTVLPDGQHQLLVYKVEDQTRFKDPSVSYLQLPYSTKQIQSALAVQSTSSIGSSSPSCASFHRNSRESVTVAFYLCSTKLTQNGFQLYSPDVFVPRQTNRFFLYSPQPICCRCSSGNLIRNGSRTHSTWSCVSEGRS
jgi:hypothetical protein